ncbi:hypothetical protein [Cupriavidus sp. M-11]|uniref:hypothetical protein n=1 Tax=Cupriavidus sp. M-11 TaxID=3233038 RepID=UPI003F90F062
MRRYAAIVVHRLHRSSEIAIDEPSHLADIPLEPLLRLTWFLGAYATQHRAKAQKIAGVMHFAQAGAMVRATASILLNWPEGFHGLLDEIGEANGGGKGGNKLGAHFGRFYPSLYKDFSDPCFAFLREGFERYLDTHWTGQLAARNRRLPAKLRSAYEWKSIKEAARMLHMRTTAVKQLIQEGALEGRLHRSASGRAMGSVSAASIRALDLQRRCLVTLKELRELTGLSKRRLNRFLSDGSIPAVSGPGYDGRPVWQFEKSCAIQAISAAVRAENSRAAQNAV